MAVRLVAESVVLDSVHSYLNQPGKVEEISGLKDNDITCAQLVLDHHPGGRL